MIETKLKPTFDMSPEQYIAQVRFQRAKELLDAGRRATDVAFAVGNKDAARAVGMANNRNPILIIVPCHRVVGKDGKLVGYAGGIDRKQYLLKMETAF